MSHASTQSATEFAPRIDDVVPAAALPGGEIELTGAHLGPIGSALPTVLVDGHSAHVLMSRPGALALRVPEQATTGLIEVRNSAGSRSEERRVGKEGRSRWSPYHLDR